MSFQFNPFTSTLDKVGMAAGTLGPHIQGSRLIPLLVPMSTTLYYPPGKHRVISYVNGNGGAVFASLAAGYADGDEHTIIGCSNVSSVSLSSADQEMNGDYTLSNGSVITFVWTSDFSSWLEVSRNGL